MNALSSNPLHLDGAIWQSDLVCSRTAASGTNITSDLYIANPTLLGLIGFLIPYTSTVLILCQFRGAIPPYSLAGLSGDYYFLGAIAMNLAGVAEFILGNSTYNEYSTAVYTDY